MFLAFRRLAPSMDLSLSLSLSLLLSVVGKFGESRKRATLNGANRRCRAAKGCRLKGKQFSWKQLTADWRERTRGSERARGRDIWRSMHASLPARERSYICPTMKIDFERALVWAPRGGGKGGMGEGGWSAREGVVKTLVSRPGIRVSRHNATALWSTAPVEPPKATPLSLSLSPSLFLSTFRSVFSV